MIFEFNLIYQAVFPTWPKSQDKNVNILRMKRTLKAKQKAFFIVFNGLSLKKNKIFLESESPTLTGTIAQILTPTTSKFD